MHGSNLITGTDQNKTKNTKKYKHIFMKFVFRTTMPAYSMHVSRRWFLMSGGSVN